MEGGASVAAFECRTGEEAAVEERDGAEGAGGGCAVAEWGVEGAEGQWGDEAWPEVSAIGEAGFSVSGEEGAIVVEPPFGFEELEEEQSGNVDQCEGTSVVGIDAIGPGGGEISDVGVECAEEACADRVASEQVVPAEDGAGRVGVPGRREGGDRLGVGIEWVGGGGGKNGEAWSAGRGEPAGDGEGAVVGALQEKQVSSGIGEAIEVGSEASERVAPGCSWELFDDEGGGVWAAGDASDVEVGGE